MRNLVFCIVVASLCPGIGLSQSHDIELLGYGWDVHGSLDVSYQSKYLWRGFDVYGDEAALQVTAGLSDIMGSGVGVAVARHQTLGTGTRAGDRLDLTLYYADSVFSGEVFATAYRIGWVHYNYPKLVARQQDLEEVHAMFSWPNLLDVPNLVPSYALVGMWPAYSGNSLVGDASGFFHIMMLDYSFSVPGAFPETPEQVFRCHSELVYNDGVSPYNSIVVPGWSHAVFGVSTDVELGFGIVLVPSINYQASMEETVNPDDEAWATVSARYSF